MRLVLSRRGAKRLRGGHPWVLANELDKSELSAVSPGDLVELRDDRDHFLGWGFASPESSLAAVRVVARNAKADPEGAGFYVARLREAMEARFRSRPATPEGRLFHGAADGLPGLVIDRYEDEQHGTVLRVDLGTPGLEQRADLVQQALLKVVQPQGLWLSGNTWSRRHEGMDPSSGRWLGEVPEILTVVEHGVACQASLIHGLPHDFALTGARGFALGLMEGRRVLDLRGGSGALAVSALVHGATEVLMADHRELALELTAAVAEDNGVSEGLTLARGEPVGLLADLRSEKERFDLVFAELPLPSTQTDGRLEWRRTREHAEAAMRCLEPAGLLVATLRLPGTPADRVLHELIKAGKSAGKALRLVRAEQQGPDFPVHPALPESSIVQQLVLQVR